MLKANSKFLISREHPQSSSAFIRNLCLSLLIFSSIFLINGCTYHLTEDGVKHIYGFGYAKIDTQLAENNDGLENIKVTNYGMLFSQTPINNGLALGYNEESIIVFNGSSCLFVAPSNNKTGDLEGLVKTTGKEGSDNE